MPENEHPIIETPAGGFELRVDDALMPSVVRALGGVTDADRQVDSLALPERPYLLKAAIKTLRWYRLHVGAHLGHRCVFAPSCSRYAELALRQRGGA